MLRQEAHIEGLEMHKLTLKAIAPLLLKRPPFLATTATTINSAITRIKLIPVLIYS